MIYLQLFYAFLKIGVFGFGGGYAMLSLIQTEIVDSHHWITSAEFMDIVAISQMTPGPIAINSATYVGYASTGTVWGAAVATLAVTLPSMVIMLLLTRFYLKLRNNRHVQNIMFGLQPMVVAMILAAALMLANRANIPDYKAIIILVATVILSVFKVHPILLIILSGVAGFFIY